MSTTTATTTTTTIQHNPSALPSSRVSDIRSRRHDRHLSSPSAARQVRLQLCKPLPHSLEALDLSSASPTHTLASLRLLVLYYLADIERRLTELESPYFETWKAKGEHKMEEARQWARTTLDMLQGIRAEVCSHLPELHLADMEGFIKSRFPDFPDVSGLADVRLHLPEIPDVRSHLPDMPLLPELSNVRSHLPDFGLSDVRSKLDDVRSRINDIDFRQPLSYIPTLSDRLKTLHSHLTAVEVQAGLSTTSLAPNTLLSDLLEALLASEVVSEVIEDVIEGEELFEKAALEVANAVKRSFQGVRLIRYSDLPQPWRNNPFVTHGYSRFIPIEKWPMILLSVFALHNETLNIHTHLIPFLVWGINTISYIGRQTIETPELLFMTFALLCLFCSALWHTMSGCAHHRSMLLCARADYVGIGWLISASVGTVVYYGFQCYPTRGHVFLWFCFLTGLAGNVLPFMDWFNQRRYRHYRIAFFLAMALSSIAPLAGLSLLHTPREVYSFISPVVPSLISYLVGLFFYAAHFPERVLPERLRASLDNIGLGSHMIWHCFIVLAVSQHKAAIGMLKPGLQCTA
ncbi:hypothetical protein AMATHDRAFT_8127 [Amanita thiersii Skay4041]|uniref:HlyIII-domain-containing protein n=1 Tax=Amanita thiersii Skay4041 TaxID=703135 RepID=A0A2A9N8M2_9AGAR|nr:hypothetical protein AMATHDRAFT_8127 [Amanita thiersii Skay4041]